MPFIYQIFFGNVEKTILFGICVWFLKIFNFLAGEWLEKRELFLRSYQINCPHNVYRLVDLLLCCYANSFICDTKCYMQPTYRPRLLLEESVLIDNVAKYIQEAAMKHQFHQIGNLHTQNNSKSNIVLLAHHSSYSLYATRVICKSS